MIRMMMKRIVKIDIYFIIQLTTDETRYCTLPTKIKRFKFFFTINMQARVSITKRKFLHQAKYAIKGSG